VTIGSIADAVNKRAQFDGGFFHIIHMRQITLAEHFLLQGGYPLPLSIEFPGNCLPQQFIRISPALALDIPFEAGYFPQDFLKGILIRDYFVKQVTHVFLLYGRKVMDIFIESTKHDSDIFIIA
jgi:hypothetical protein